MVVCIPKFQQFIKLLRVLKRLFTGFDYLRERSSWKLQRILWMIILWFLGSVNSKYPTGFEYLRKVFVELSIATHT